MTEAIVCSSAILHITSTAHKALVYIDQHHSTPTFILGIVELRREGPGRDHAMLDAQLENASCSLPPLYSIQFCING
jgi:hypothetical protein